jgi:parvulin-like peptidyl-prolyl isomerase
MVAMLIVASAVLSASAWAGERQVLEAILVRVNERIVTVSDFKQRMRTEMGQMPQAPPPDQLEAFARGYLNTVADEMVLLERATEKQLLIDDEQLDQAIAGLREENNLQDDQAFEQALAEAGLTVEGLRDRYRHNMTLQRVVQSEITPTEITEEEVRQVYEEEKEGFAVPKMVELEQLFFELGEGESDEQLSRRVSGLVQRVTEGADLKAEATLAGVELQELGAIPEDDLRPERRQALAELEDGDLSQPLEASGGYLVLRLLRRVPAGYMPFDDVKEQIRRRLSMESYQSQSQGLVNQLRSNYLVEVNEERLALVLDGWDQ